MIIAFDAKWFYNGNVSGRSVVTNMVKRFSIDHSNHTFYIILNKNDKSKKFPYQSKNIKLLYVRKIINNQITNIFLAYKLQKLKIDIGVFQYYAPVFSNFKTVVYIHDVIFKSNPEYFTLRERIYFSSMRYFASLSDAVLTVSKTEINRLLKFSFFPKTGLIDFIYNGVDDTFKQAKLPMDADSKSVKLKYLLPERFILYVGRLNNRKNLLGLIESLRYIHDTDIKLVLVGSHDWKSFDIESKIRDLNLRSRIILLGHVKSEDLSILYSISTAFCYVSFAEGFGMPVLEALKSGIPVVVSELEVFKELFTEIPYYVNPYSPISIADGINRVLSSENHLRIEEGLRLAKNFSWEASARKLILFLENVGGESI